ncbi:unnamed protein product [Sphagnum balticum]
MLCSSYLLNHHIDLVSGFHVEVLGGLVLVEALSVEEESNVVGLELAYGLSYALALAICIHKFLELGGGLDLEEDLFAVLSGGIVTWLLTLRLSCSAGGAGSAMRKNEYNAGQSANWYLAL